MTWMPGADTSRKATDFNNTQRMKRWDGVCVHTIVGYAPAEAAHFSVNDDGSFFQHRSIDFQSAANYQGNPRIVAIENEDHGTGFTGYWKTSDDVPPMTPAQCETNAQIIAWVYEEKGIPIVRMPDSLPTSRGVAIHRLGCDGNYTDGYPGRVEGGEIWTKAFGKLCPAVRRINQTYEIIIPRARVIAGLDQEKDMPDSEMIHDIAWRLDGLVKGHEIQAGGPGEGDVLTTVRDFRALIWRIEALISMRDTVAGGPTSGETVEIVKTLKEINAKLDALQPPTGEINE